MMRTFDVVSYGKASRNWKFSQNCRMQKVPLGRPYSSRPPNPKMKFLVLALKRFSKRSAKTFPIMTLRRNQPKKKRRKKIKNFTFQRFEESNSNVFIYSKNLYLKNGINFLLCDLLADIETLKELKSFIDPCHISKIYLENRSSRQFRHLP